MITAIVWIILFGVSLLLVGVVASFSVILYATLFTVLSSTKHPYHKGILVTVGLSGGLLLLALLFMGVQPEIFLVRSAMTTAGAVHTNAVDVALGLICLIGGVFVLYRKRTLKDSSKLVDTKKMSVTKKRAGDAALVGLGFIRGITRITGVAALLFAVRMIMHAVDQPVFQLVWVLVLVALSMVPYAIIFALRLWYPTVFRHAQRSLQRITGLRPGRYLGEVLITVGMLFMGLSFL